MSRATLPILLLPLVVGGSVWALRRHQPQPPVQSPATVTATLTEAAARLEPPAITPLLDALRADLQVHRQLIVLFADEANLTGAALERALAVGHRLHHERRDLVHQLNQALTHLRRAKRLPSGIP